MSKLKVLIPVDGTEFSEAIFPKLSLLAEPKNVEIMLLKVSSLVPQAVAVAHGPYASDYSPTLAEANRRHSVIQEMTPMAEKLEARGYEVDCEVGFGEPAQQILFFAELGQPDLIAMATHGREGISRLLVGSVAETVLHGSHVPVLMFRPDDMPL